MEDQLELSELRKAQSELNDAFGFRRSINVDQSAEAFSSVPPMNEPVAEAGAAAAVATAEVVTQKKKRRKRKRVKKKATPLEDVSPSYSGEIPDLDMTKAFSDEIKEQTNVDLPLALGTEEETEEAFSARLRQERIDRLEEASQVPASDTTDWFSASESEVASEVLSQSSDVEQSRFASQLSGDWNQQILDNDEKLSPLGKIMDRISLLEEERMAENARLQEEFRLRKDIDEKYYREKRAVLEEAATEISMSAFGDVSYEKEDVTKDSMAQDEKLETSDAESSETIEEEKKSILLHGENTNATSTEFEKVPEKEENLKSSSEVINGETI